MNWFRWNGNQLVLQLKIQPGAKHSEFAGLYGEYLKVRIQAPPIEGRANVALQSFLSTAFATARQDVQLERGELGRIKTVRIHAPRALPEELLQLGMTTGQ